MANEYMPVTLDIDEELEMTFGSDEQMTADLGEMMTLYSRANYNQTDPKRLDYIVGREKIQEKLTAGKGITIDENNEISASGGGATYTAGDGVSIDENNEISVDTVDTPASQSPLPISSGGVHLALTQLSNKLDTSKQSKLTAGEGISIDENNEISVETVDSALYHDKHPISSGGVLIELNKKQDKLTAGEGITIDANNKISAEVSADITVDTELSDTSTNPVANKAVTAELNKKQNALTAGDGIAINDATISANVPKIFSKLDIGTPEMYKAKGDGKTNDMDALQKALRRHRYVLATGKYYIAPTERWKKLTLSGTMADENDQNIGTALYKILDLKGSLILDGVPLHIHGENMTLCGGGIIRGIPYKLPDTHPIYPDDTEPTAMVMLGGTQDNQSIYATHCTIKDLSIISDDTEAKTIGLLMRNYFNGKYSCYCNTIDNIYFSDTNVGINMVGDANGNNISNISMRSYACKPILDNGKLIPTYDEQGNLDGGHETEPDVKCMFRFDGLKATSGSTAGTNYAPKENNFNSCFYYRGLGSPMLLIMGNTQDDVYYNTFANMTCEQQGEYESFLQIVSPATPHENVFVGIVANCNETQNFADDYTENTFFEQSNKIFSNHDTYATRIKSKYLEASTSVTAPTVTASGTVAGKIADISSAIYFGANNETIEQNVKKTADENTEITLCSINLSTLTNGGIIEMLISENSNTGTAQYENRSKVLIAVQPSGMTIFDQIASRSDGKRTSISGNKVIYKTGNASASATQTIKVIANIRIVSYNTDVQNKITFGA